MSSILGIVFLVIVRRSQAERKSRWRGRNEGFWIVDWKREDESLSMTVEMMEAWKISLDDS